MSRSTTKSRRPRKAKPIPPTSSAGGVSKPTLPAKLVEHQAETLSEVLIRLAETCEDEMMAPWLRKLAAGDRHRQPSEPARE
jgi:hypothetical protein